MTTIAKYPPIGAVKNGTGHGNDTTAAAHEALHLFNAYMAQGLHDYEAKIGRPTKYTEELAGQFLDYLIEGRGLRFIEKQTGFS